MQIETKFNVGDTIYYLERKLSDGTLWEAQTAL